MQSKFAQKRTGTLNKFFTKMSVGTLMAQQIEMSAPVKVLDLGAGEGALCASVVRRWPKAEVVTVDVDASSAPDLSENLKEAGCEKHRHYCLDVLDSSLVRAIDERGGFDLAVCNPPFFNPAWSRDHADILREAGLAGACNSVAEVTAEVLFLAQCLSLLKERGKLALIVPDGVVTSARAKMLRKVLLTEHRLEKVIQLPLNSFSDTDALCYILILEKGMGPTENVEIFEYDRELGVSAPLIISNADAEERWDHNYHLVNHEVEGEFTTLRSLGATVQRGSISTVQRKAADYPTFHTTDYKSVREGNIRLPQTSLDDHAKKVVAEAGDILLARVDRYLYEKIGMVTQGSAVITDCIYRIRVPNGDNQRAFDALCSSAGRDQLRRLTKGVGARLLGKADLLDMPLPIISD